MPKYRPEDDTITFLWNAFTLLKRKPYLKYIYISLLSQAIRLIFPFDLKTKIVSFATSIDLQSLSNDYMFISKSLLSVSESNATCTMFSRSVLCDILWLWTVTHKASGSMGFSRQEYWSGLPFTSPGCLLTQGLNLHLLHWQFFTTEPPGKPLYVL